MMLTTCKSVHEVQSCVLWWFNDKTLRASKMAAPIEAIWKLGLRIDHSEESRLREKTCSSPVDFISTFLYAKPHGLSLWKI